MRVDPQTVYRILAVTDALGIHREAVSIPLVGRGAGSVGIAKSGRLEIVPPATGDLEAWLVQLPEVLGHLDLAPLRRA